MPSVYKDLRIWITGGYGLKPLYRGSAYKDRPEIIFLQKWTGQKILEGADWSSHTKSKQKRQNWTGHSYVWPVLISAGPCIRGRSIFPKNRFNLTEGVIDVRNCIMLNINFIKKILNCVSSSIATRANMGVRQCDG